MFSPWHESIYPTEREKFSASQGGKVLALNILFHETPCRGSNRVDTAAQLLFFISSTAGNFLVSWGWWWAGLLSGPLAEGLMLMLSKRGGTFRRHFRREYYTVCMYVNMIYTQYTGRGNPSCISTYGIAKKTPLSQDQHQHVW